MRDFIVISSAIILATAVLAWDIKSDFRYWKEEKPINHNNQGFKRILLLSPSIIMLAIPISWWAIAAATPMIMFWYWLLFDGLLSNKKRFNFWSLGSDGPEDGVLDNFLQSLKRWQHIAIKIGGVIISTTLYILLYD